MDQSQNLYSKIFNISERNFDQVALEIFKYQSKNNLIYKKYLKLLGVNVNGVKYIREIPFIPIDFFKDFKVTSGNWEPETTFLSSGTSGQQRSKHHIRNLLFYKNVSLRIFNQYYGDPKQYHIFALLPSYNNVLQNSSLIQMVKFLIDASGSDLSGFYFDDFENLKENIQFAKSLKGRVILLGVSFALLDFGEKLPINLDNSIIIETGGMKGQRREITRNELHNKLKSSFNVKKVHSEYGMTELLSQAYSKENGKFYTPQWMKIVIRDIYDPYNTVTFGKTGGLNIIDLANIDSCSFIETQDMGVLHTKQYFEVIGRLDNSEIRGCNLLIS